jgi:hypothetical protein
MSNRQKQRWLTQSPPTLYAQTFMLVTIVATLGSFGCSESAESCYDECMREAAAETRPAGSPPTEEEQNACAVTCNYHPE